MHRTAARRTSAVTLACFLLTLCACSDGGSDGGVVAPPIDVPIDAVELLTTAPRIDLPGRLTQPLRVVGPEGEGLGDVALEDFEVIEGGVVLDQDRIALRPVGGTHATFVHLVLDRTDSLAADPTRLAALEAAGQAAVDALLGAPGTSVAVGWFGADGLVPAEGAGGTPLGFVDDPNLLATALSSPPVGLDGSACDLHAALVGAATATVAAADEQVAANTAQSVDRVLLVVADGPDDVGSTSAQEVVLAIEALDARAVALGPDAELSTFDGLGFDAVGAASEPGDLASVAEQQADAIAARSAAVRRLAWLSLAVDGDGVVDTLLRIAQEDEQAQVQVSYAAVGFSPGAGFVEPTTLPDDGPAPTRVVDLIAEPDGSLTVLSDPAGAVFHLTRLLPDGTPDTSFGLDGILGILGGSTVGDPPPWSPVAFAEDPAQAGRWYVAVREGSELDIRTRVFRVGPFSPIVSALMPRVDPAWSDFANDLIVDEQGRVVVAGASGVSTAKLRRAFVWRLDAELVPDPTFGTDGLAEYGPGTASAIHTAKSIVRGTAPDRYYVAGEERLDAVGEPDLRVFALDDAGAVDPGFGTGGSVVNAGTFHTLAVGGLGAAGRIDLDDLGLLVVTGAIQDLADGHLVPAMWRMDTDGAPDPTFVGDASNPFGTGNPNGGVGLVALGGALTDPASLPFGEDTVPEDHVFGPAGEHLLTGRRTLVNGFLDAVWLRFDADGALDTTFNGTGYLIEDGTLGAGWSEFSRTITIRADGSLATGGYTNNVQLGLGDVASPLVILDDDPSRAF